MIEQGVSTSLKDLQIRNKFDGAIKFLTNECEDCEGYLRLSDGEVCKLGKVWKQLSREGKILKTCAFLKGVEKKRVIQNAPKMPVLVYTPGFLDFIGDTEEILISMGFEARFVKPGEEGSPGFSVRWE